MIVADDLGGLRDARAALTPGRVAFVPTMGALHAGHRALLRRARQLGEVVVASIFVNPRQFGPGEDLDRYPRTLEADLEICRAEGVDLVFVPTTAMMYPRDPTVTVSSGVMGMIVEGAARPGHFDGMLTVVLKLFHLVAPDLALFGEKDAQQLAMIRRMAEDLNLPIEIVGIPTVREPDGLALSSRNRYLSPSDRAVALTLSRALRAGTEAAPSGPDEVVRRARAVLAAEEKLDLDYLALVDPATFTDVAPHFTGTAVLAVAGRVGATHLIDNMYVALGV
jgi:pantoate--beta-alanine ligase